MMRPSLFSTVLFTIGLLIFPTKGDDAGIEFFETKVRPVLAEHCYQCHSEKSEKLKGGLLVDSREGMMKGGDTGASIVPGDPDKSLLIQAVRYTDEALQMPPKNKKLSSEQIADLEAWVKMGAPAPQKAGVKLAENKIDLVKKHWAFQPVQKPALPSVKNKRWIRNEIDIFILAGLEKNGLKPSPQADRRTLIRRASFDLIGLPPSPEEVRNFINDKAPDAYEKMIDRLLASPHYGERWARHWLDVARYADTKGYVFQEERRYPYAYTYRDYVIRAFNEDLPYNRFIVEQLAADQLELGEDKRPLAAMGYLTLGRRFLNNEPDIIDDRIDVVTRGMLGLTVSCARCHDHKYDPVPTKDYYSLYGVFASSIEPKEKPLLGKDSLPKEHPEFLVEHQKRIRERDDFRMQKEQELRAELRKRAGEYMLAAFDSSRIEDKSKKENLAKERKLSPDVVELWVKFLQERSSQSNDVIFQPWFEFAKLDGTNFGENASTLAKRFALNETSTPINPLVASILHSAPTNLLELSDRYGKLFQEIVDDWEQKKESIQSFADSNREMIRQLLYSESPSGKLAADDFPRLYDVKAAEKSRALQRKIEQLEATHPGSPPRAMALLDAEKPHNSRVFVRGSPHNLGPEVPRQFLEILSKENRVPFQKGSGRLELAEAIANKDNPLTARVLVNRVWLNHFNASLVRTPSDFGLRSEPPSHPELLDFLADYFVMNGWSLKKLHKLIMTSNTYQQESTANPEFTKVDPSNRWYWRMNMRRLELEPMRDTLLALSGKLEARSGGQPVELWERPYPGRRTVYGFIERQNLPGVFRTFDFASPDTTSPQRFSTTVPQQALFMVNSPFTIEQSRALVTRPEIASAAAPAEKVKSLYQIVFQREPEQAEISLGLKFVNEQAGIISKAPGISVWKYGYGEYQPTNAKVKNFKEFPKFVDGAWRGGDKLPDAEIGWTMINKQGGHPGKNIQHCSIRRWVSPISGVVEIHGELVHESKDGDGVIGRIISSRGGELLARTVKTSREPMKIKRYEVLEGETLDFLVDPGSHENSDGYSWSPQIKMLETPGKEFTGSTEWNAKDDFKETRDVEQALTAWEKYAQVMLMSNELLFID
ncbi:MAG: PSD1 and planctomycete cytochrome C domain-containing protein [Verrucomicrobiota bacterium]|nr:PSD1 and planctomycete cytochrome C domain-containing protein [Verrucomicrobiota bacterium]